MARHRIENKAVGANATLIALVNKFDLELKELGLLLGKGKTTISRLYSNEAKMLPLQMDVIQMLHWYCNEYNGKLPKAEVCVQYTMFNLIKAYASKMNKMPSCDTWCGESLFLLKVCKKFKSELDEVPTL